MPVSVDYQDTARAITITTNIHRSAMLPGTHTVIHIDCDNVNYMTYCGTINSNFLAMYNSSTFNVN